MIRANRNRKPALISGPLSSLKVAPVDAGTESISSVLTADDAQIGDEYISLTFNESESSEEENDDEQDDDDDAEGEEEDDHEQSISMYS